MNVVVPSGLAPIRQIQAPLRGMIIDALRGAIEGGHLQPGQRLVERTLCTQLGVSRTALREALRELQADGIVGHSGTGRLIVASLDRAEAENAYRIRAALEALVVAQFIETARPAQFAEVASRGALLLDAYRAGSVPDILVTKRALYDAICAGAGNALAFTMINRLVLRTSSLRRRSMMRRERQDRSVVEIAALLAAIEGRDVTGAKAAAETHVREGARSALGGALS